MTTALLNEIAVPDLGDAAEVIVLEVHVAVGDVVTADASLVTLESEKAAMEVPSPRAGIVSALLVAVGDRVATGTPLVVLSENATAQAELSKPRDALVLPSADPALVPSSRPFAATAPAAPQAAARQFDGSGAHAGPSTRRLAHELDVDLSGVRGTGPKGRVVKADVLAAVLPGTGSEHPVGDTGIPPVVLPDFRAFGSVTSTPLTRVQQLSGANLQRAWLNIPHVTHHDSTDITDLDAYRRTLSPAPTLLAFVLKACASALKTYPTVNSSLAADRKHLLVKDFVNLGVAVETDQGLVVPVLRHADRCGVNELTIRLEEVSGRARAGALTPADHQGGTFTISSLGSIGGIAFTPVVNSPEAAILGVARGSIQPVWDGLAFQPRLVLPLSLSYDHRIVDGALAARFMRHVCTVLADLRRLAL